MKTIENFQITQPKLDIFKEYDHIHPMKHLPRPQPSDIIINLFNHNENLFYIDIGAHDGVICSNTLVLDAGYNWKGICVEPNKTLFDKLTKNRNSKCYNVGISTERTQLEFALITGSPESLSGFIKFFSAEHKQRIQNELNGCYQNFSKILIPSIPLQDIIDENNLSTVDYLSIDAECADLEVIKSINFDKTYIKVLSHESQAGKSNEDVIIKKHLFDNGFNLFTTCCGDNIFVNRKFE